MSLQRPILSPVTTAGMLYETKTKSKMCSKCGKEIIYTDKYSLVRHINFEHNPMKNPDVVKKLNPAKNFAKVNEDFKNGIFPENWKEKHDKGFNRHNDAITNQMEQFKNEGFRVIPLGRQKDIEPDFIAIKDGKVYAVEVELDNPDYKKYDNNKDFDDIYWILLDFASSRAISRTVPTGISDSHA